MRPHLRNKTWHRDTVDLHRFSKRSLVGLKRRKLFLDGGHRICRDEFVARLNPDKCDLKPLDCFQIGVDAEETQPVRYSGRPATALP